jgi:hypothetical protein
MDRFQRAMERLAENAPADRASDVTQATAGIMELFQEVKASLAEIRANQLKLLGDVQAAIHDEVVEITRSFEMRIAALEQRGRRRREPSDHDDEHGGHP